MGVDLYSSFQKYNCFWLEKQGSTYTRIDLYTRKYDTSNCCTLKSFVSKPDCFVCALLNSIILAGFTEFKLKLIQTANSQLPFQIHL